jgi:hypothetical protein
MQCAWEVNICMFQVSMPETYAEVRNLGVKAHLAQEGVEWYVPGYTSISSYVGFQYV